MISRTEVAALYVFVLIMAWGVFISVIHAQSPEMTIQEIMDAQSVKIAQAVTKDVIPAILSLRADCPPCDSIADCAPLSQAQTDALSYTTSWFDSKGRPIVADVIRTDCLTPELSGWIIGVCDGLSDGHKITATLKNAFSELWEIE